jgi:hypothetical protein
MKCRLEVVESIPAFYNSAALDPEKCWIIHVHPEKLILDGQRQYIFIDRRTGALTDVMTN